MPANRIDDLPRELAAYRFKRLARFSAADARRVVMGFASPEGASVTITAVKQGDAWSSAPEAMAPEKIEALVDSLAQLEAVDVVAESVGGPERAALGLDPPQATFVVFGRPAVDAIEERDEDAPDVQLAEVRIGVTRGSDGIVAQSGESPSHFFAGFGRPRCSAPSAAKKCR